MKRYDVDAILEDAAKRLTEMYGVGEGGLTEKVEVDELAFHSFPQAWGSTALGHGGVGGQTITGAQTFVVGSDWFRAKAVYFGGRFAYLVPYPNPNFWECLSNFALPARGQSGRLSDWPKEGEKAK